MATINDDDGEWTLSSTGGTVNITAASYDPSSDTNFSVDNLAIAKDVSGTPTGGLYDGDDPNVTWDTTTGVITVTFANATSADWLFVAYYSYCDGGVCSGDPHVATFDGHKYDL